MKGFFVIPLPNSEQKLPFLKSYLHRVDAKSHPSSLFPLCNTHINNTHHLFNCTHIRTTLSPLDVWTDPAGVTVLLTRWMEKLAGEPQLRSSDSPSPLAMDKGMGRQQPGIRIMSICRSPENISTVFINIPFFAYH